jgi:hypothetical protein
MSIVRPSRRRATALVAGPFHDVLCVEVRTAVGRCTECGRHRPVGRGAGVRPVTRSCCGWCGVPDAIGWTCGLTYLQLAVSVVT